MLRDASLTAARGRGGVLRVELEQRVAERGRRAGLDGAELVDVDAGVVGELLDGEAGALAQRADGRRDRVADGALVLVVVGHGVTVRGGGRAVDRLRAVSGAGRRVRAR